MAEIKKQTSTTYAFEVYEAIKQFTAEYVKYSISITSLKENDTSKVSEETLPGLQDLIHNLRYYEKHAWIRLRAIGSVEKIDLVSIGKQRPVLLERVPVDAEVEKLILEYNKILATKFTDKLLKTEAETVDDLAGNL